MPSKPRPKLTSETHEVFQGMCRIYEDGLTVVYVWVNGKRHIVTAGINPANRVTAPPVQWTPTTMPKVGEVDNV